jgi:hypothetical protein
MVVKNVGVGHGSASRHRGAMNRPHSGGEARSTKLTTISCSGIGDVRTFFNLITTKG